jgi:hypothetical protein
MEMDGEVKTPKGGEGAFPRFHVIRHDSGEVFGSVTATTYGIETWVGDGWIGYLLVGMKPISGRWHARGESWGFMPDDHCVGQELRTDTECTVLDGYWGERAELVLDSDRKWQAARYEGSDHDHCAICWEKLGQCGQPDGYVSKGATWICCCCYEAFVQRRSLEFIPRS